MSTAYGMYIRESVHTYVYTLCAGTKACMHVTLHATRITIRTYVHSSELCPDSETAQKTIPGC